MCVYSLPVLGSDYGLEREIVRFGACELRQCVTIPIRDDNIVEDTESFSIHLEKSAGLSSRFTADPGVKVINITDNDGMLSTQGSILVDHFTVYTHILS